MSGFEYVYGRIGGGGGFALFPDCFFFTFKK